MRFHDVVINPCLATFEDRRARHAWADAQASLRTQVYGPAFEELAREWTAHRADEATLGGPVGEVGTSVVNDASARSQHEVDVIALAAGQRRQARHPTIHVLGEAKDSDRVRTGADLARLEHIRSLLVARGIDAAAAKLLLFGRSGFGRDLVTVARARLDVELVDLHRIRYGT